jgi:hypothetical protein
MRAQSKKRPERKTPYDFNVAHHVPRMVLMTAFVVALFLLRSSAIMLHLCVPSWCTRRGGNRSERKAVLLSDRVCVRRSASVVSADIYITLYKHCNIDRTVSFLLFYQSVPHASWLTLSASAVLRSMPHCRKPRWVRKAAKAATASGVSESKSTEPCTGLNESVADIIADIKLLCPPKVTENKELHCHQCPGCNLKKPVTSVKPKCPSQEPCYKHRKLHNADGHCRIFVYEDGHAHRESDGRMYNGDKEFVCSDCDSINPMDPGQSRNECLMCGEWSWA